MKVLVLGGPEVLTLADVTRAVYRADGTSVRILPVPMLLARIGLSIGGLIPGFPMGGDQYRSLAFDNTVSDDSLDEFGLDSSDLRTFGEYLATDGEPAGATEPDAAGGVRE